MLLVLAPWSALWEQNYFAHAYPVLGAVMVNAFFRGAVTGVGLVTAFAGLRDVTALLFARHASRESGAS